MEEVRQFLTNLRAKCKRKGAELPVFLKEADPKQTGTMTPGRFRKLLHDVDLLVSDDKFEFYIAPYHQNNLFYYEQFITELDNAPRKLPKNRPSDDDLKAFGKYLRDRGINLVDFCRTYDKQRSAQISVQLFLRHFGNTKTMIQISEYFSHPVTKQVEYELLASEIDKILRAQDETPIRTQKERTPQFDDLLKEFYSQFNTRKIDYKSIFRKDDKTGSGYVPKQAFLSILSNIGLKIHPNRIQELASFYEVQGKIDYISFVNHLIELSAQLTKPVPKKKNVADIGLLLNRLSDDFIKRKSTIESQVKDMDRDRTLNIPFFKFIRLLQKYGFQLSPLEVEALQLAFSDDAGQFSYPEFFEAIRPVSYKDVADPDEILENIRETLDSLQLQMRPHFSKLGKQWISFTQFSGVLRDLGFSFTETEYQALRQKLGNDVDFQMFCDEFDPIIKEKPEEVFPEFHQLDKGEVARVALEVMTKVAAASMKFGFNIEADFRRSDIKKEGMIQPDEFKKVIRDLPLYFTDKEIELTAIFYETNGLVNYIHFCKDMSEFGFKKLDPNPEVDVKKDEILDVTPALKKIYFFLATKEIPPESLFLPYDGTQCGYILQTRIGGIFQQAGLALKASEIALLATFFQDTRLSERFNYKMFIQALKELEVSIQDQHDAKIEPRRLEPNVLKLLGEIQQRLNERKRKIRTPFQGVNTPYISIQDFRNCINSFGLVFSEAQIQLLIRGYRVNVKGDINWNQFCYDVENANPLR